MEFQRKYPVTRLTNEHVLVTWDRGYRNIQLFFRDRLITQVASPSLIKKGFKVQDQDLNWVELRFSDRPMTLDLIIDGFHSPINRSHPIKEIGTSSRIFWMVFILACIGTLIGAMQYGVQNPLGLINLVFDLIFTSCYFIASITLQNDKPWGYFVGITGYTISMLLFIMALLGSAIPIAGIVHLVVRLGVFVVLIRYLKDAISAMKHLKYQNNYDDSLLDS